MINLTIAGVTYPFPQTGDENWGDNVTDWAVAVSSKLLQKSGGLFQLTAEVDFGTTYGVKSAYFKSRGTNPATAGILRLANTEAVAWRNFANGADLSLVLNASDQLTFNSARVLIAGLGLIVNADVNAAAAIAYSKLNLSGAIVNADVNASAAIAYSKLALTGSIVNADVNASAAIAYSKLALTGSIVNADINASAAIAYSKLALTGSIVNADVNASAAIARSKLAAGTADHVVINAASTGVFSSEAQLAVARGGTNIGSYTSGDTIYASGATTLAKLAKGTDGQVLKLASGLPSWASAVPNLAVSTKTTTFTATTSENVLLCSTAGGAYTGTLFTPVGNTGYVLYIEKTTQDFSVLTISGTGLSTTLDTLGEQLVVVSDGTNWVILSRTIPSAWVSFTPVSSWVLNATPTGKWRRVGDSIQIQAYIVLGGVTTAAALTINNPTNCPAIDTTKLAAGTAAGIALPGSLGSMLDSGSRNYGVQAVYSSTTAVSIVTYDPAGGGTNTIVPPTQPFTFAINDSVAANWIVPITGWNG